MNFPSDPSYVPDTTNYGILFLLRAGNNPDDWVRLWSGKFDLHVAPEAEDTAGGTYRGLDFPLAIPEIEGCLNGATSSGEFQISGVSETALSLLAEDSDDIIGARLFVGIQDFDNRWQPTNAITWLLRAYAGRPRSTGRGGEKNITYTMSLPWQTDFYDRNQAYLSYWSAVAQRRRYPGDRFFDEIIRMAQGMVIKWML